MKWFSSFAFAFLLLVNFVFTISGQGAALQEPASPAATSKIYLPIITTGGSSAGGGGPRPLDVFGVETSYVDGNLLAKADSVNASWWRYFSFNWKAIEPNDVDPPQYNWSAVNEHHLQQAAANGFTIVATVKYTPYWAQAIPDSQSIQCSPIKEDARTLAEFKEFITAIVNRYKAPPYNIKYWQFWNEPDVAPEVLIAINQLYDSPFGCWGDNNDPYYGGERYGRFLAVFAQTVKAADPQAKVTNGGMLLDCNPEENPTNCIQGKFFEGTLRGLSANNGVPYLDYVSFHTYGQWYGNLKLDEGWSGFKDGGVLLGKSKFLRKVMADYGINPVKPLLITEASLMCRRSDDAPALPSGKKCSDSVPPPEYEDDQAEYIVWVYVRAIADGISGVMWYQLNYMSYRHVGLLYSDGSSKPAYRAYQAMVNQLRNTTFNSTLNQFFPTLRAYEFNRGEQRLWVMWAPDQVDHVITLPAGFVAAYDKFGDPVYVPPGADSLIVNSPIYLILK